MIIIMPALRPLFHCLRAPLSPQVESVNSTAQGAQESPLLVGLQVGRRNLVSTVKEIKNLVQPQLPLESSYATPMQGVLLERQAKRNWDIFLSNSF